MPYYRVLLFLSKLFRIFYRSGFFFFFRSRNFLSARISSSLDLWSFEIFISLFSYNLTRLPIPRNNLFSSISISIVIFYVQSAYFASFFSLFQFSSLQIKYRDAYIYNKISTGLIIVNKHKNRHGNGGHVKSN